MSLYGMRAVGLAVQHVVDQVERARRRAKNSKRAEGTEKRSCTECQREERRGKHDDVLNPLRRAQGAHQRRKARLIGRGQNDVPRSFGLQKKRIPNAQTRNPKRRACEQLASP